MAGGVWHFEYNLLQHTHSTLHTLAKFEGPTHATMVQHPGVQPEIMGRGAQARRGPFFLRAQRDGGPSLRVWNLRFLHVCCSMLDMFAKMLDRVVGRELLPILLVIGQDSSDRDSLTAFMFE
jgi:hypothetical protein